jgi:hypothetical protein
MTRAKSGCALAVLVAAGGAGCRRDVELPKESPARVAALQQLATSDQQKKLWEAAAARPAPGVAELPFSPPTAAAVRPSTRSVAVPPAFPGLAPYVESGVGIVAGAVPGKRVAGLAKVVAPLDPTGERLRLALPEGQVIELAVRLHKGPLAKLAGTPLAVGDAVELDLLVPAPRESLAVFVARVPEGALVAEAMDGGSGPVRLELPRLDLVAQQVGPVASGTMPVEVRVGKTVKRLAEGESAELAPGLAVKVVLSGGELRGSDGTPYFLRLLVLGDPRPPKLK